MKVYILRHAESLSYSNNISFESDPGLSDLGQKQAELTARYLEHLDIELVISSSTNRAKETAEIIAKKIKKPLQIEDKIKEMAPPRLDNVADQHGFFLNVLNSIGSSPKKKDVKDDRNTEFEEVEARAEAFIKKLSGIDKNVLLVTHSTFSRILVLHMILGSFILPEQVKTLHLDHSGLSVCDNQEGIWRILKWNENHYLIKDGVSYLSQSIV